MITNYEDWKKRKPNEIKKAVIKGGRLIPLKDASDALAGYDVVVSSFIYDMLKDRIKELEAGMREIYEVFAGSEGDYSAKYRTHLVEQMRDIASNFLKEGE